jgi:serpin B
VAINDAGLPHAHAQKFFAAVAGDLLFFKKVTSSFLIPAINRFYIFCRHIITAIIMKRRTAAIALAATVAFPKICLSQEGAMAITAAENAFAVDLYKRLGKAPGNFFVSPYSIAAALGMVYAGAKGRTAEEIAHALHLDAVPRDMFLQQVKQAPPVGGDGITFETANALWGADRYPFKHDYLATIKAVFGGSLTPLDFSNPEAAADTINGWVAQKTNNRIQDLISPEALNALTRLVLTNAVYFKAPWSTQFSTYDTVPTGFRTATGTKMVPTMNITDFYSYGAGVGVKLLALPYGQGGMSMVIILPDAADGLAAVEADLDAARLEGWIAAGQSTKVRLVLPKFKTESAFDLNAPLQSLGITAAFNPLTADLTGIADVPHDKLYVSDAIHKTYIDVDENGTEAAAATAVMMAAAAAMAPGPPPPVPFIVDHPFLYLIQDAGTGRILFMGRVTDPA